MECPKETMESVLPYRRGIIEMNYSKSYKTIDRLNGDFGSDLSSDFKNKVIEQLSLSKTSFDQDVYDLLIRIDEGYLATLDEKTMLGNVEHIQWRNITKIPSSIGMLASLRLLVLYDNKVNDIRALSKLKSLFSLDLSYTQVSDISVLSKLTSLEYLDLSRTQVSDISALSGLKNLRTLDLSRIKINDLNALSGLSNLKHLNLQNSKTAVIPESILDLNLEFIATEKGSDPFSDLPH